MKEVKAEMASTKKEIDLLRDLNEQLVLNAKVYKQKAEEAEKKLQEEQRLREVEVKDLNE